MKNFALRVLTYLFLTIFSVAVSFAESITDSRQLPIHQIIPAANQRVETEDEKLPKPDAGCIYRHSVYSSQMDATYIVDVWLPEGYDKNRNKPYPVIYAQDGQNLFDPNITWNNQTWDVDKNIARLGNSIDSPIVVGVHSTMTRAADYIPRRPIEGHPGLEKDLIECWNQKEIRSDKYLDFIVNVVKPMIEENYNVREDIGGVAAMGSSLGGLFSLYAMCEYPDKFGIALCLSTHWPGLYQSSDTTFPEAMMDYLENNLSSDGLHKLYIDHGTKGLDVAYEPWNNKARQIAVDKGYKDGETVMAYKDPDGDHNEKSWCSRLERPLLFAFSTSNTNLDSQDVYVYLYYSGATEDDRFYSFVYDSNNQNNAGWPGSEMQFTRNITVNGVAGDWFVYKVPSYLSYSGLAIVSDNGNRRYPANMEPGVLLHGKSLAFIFNGNKWVVEEVADIAASSVTDIFDNPDISEFSIYNLNGIRVSANIDCLPKGLYIVCKGNKTFKIQK